MTEARKPTNGSAAPPKRTRKGGTDYNAGSIQVLEGLEAVRRRPGMYIGSTDERGLHHLVWEVVDNSIDEAMAGHAKIILVNIKADGMVVVQDDGRGVPVGKHSTGKDALEVVHTVLHAGGKFGGGGYKVSGGLHGVGVSVVNALSSWMRVESARDGSIWAQEYERGKPRSSVKKIGPQGTRRGTTTSFRADAEMFETVEYSFETISQRLRESAYLTKGVWITLIDERVDRERSFYFEGGLQSFVRHLNRNKEPLHSRPIYVERKEGSTAVEVALQYNDTYTENVLAFANNINTPDGGSHVTGFRAALTSSLNDWARRAGVLKDNDTNLSGDDVREGLTAVISVKLTDPAVRGPDEGEARQRRGQGPGPDGRRRQPRPIPRREPGRWPADHREVPHRRPRPRGGPQGPRPRHPQGRPRWACPCRASSPTARSATPRGASCTSSRATRPVARPSRAAIGVSRPSCRCAGKLLNVEKARLDKILVERERAPLIIALGRRASATASTSTKLRYHRIIIMTDADVDGAHIRTLLLTFFYRHMPEVIDAGYLYIAQPPLYRVSTGKVTALRPERAGARADHQGVQRQEPVGPALQGPRRDERRSALGDDDEPGDADAAPRRHRERRAWPTRSSRC